VITSIFEIPCSIFCGSKNGSQDGVNLDWFSPKFCLLTSDYWAFALSLGPCAFDATSHTDYHLAVVLRDLIDFASKKRNDSADKKGKHENCQQ
jgi:hypothetical protein